MKRYFRCSLAALLILATSPLFAVEPAEIIFVAGEANVADQTVRIGDLIHEGETLTTGPHGYLYLKTRDNGFFILRPNSTGKIISYHIDAQNPSNNRIKLELQQGVARHISGDAVKNSRQNFRFNTPVAAIGVRGTDFTVFANQETTRIAVFSGGVVVSPLSSECLASGHGPCEGMLSRELFANKMDQALEVNRGQAPVLIKGSEKAPDSVTPPRNDEPNSKASSRSQATNNLADSPSINLDPLKTSTISQLAQTDAIFPKTQQVKLDVPRLPEPPQLIWGRWQALANQTIEVDVAALQATNQLIATNNYYALMRNRETAWQPPTQATLAFSMQDSQAVIQDQVSQKLTPAKIENGQLQIDFAKLSFFTKFDLVSSNERFTLQNKGEVSSDGRLYGGNQFLLPNNMDVRGALSNDNKTAAYLFQSRLDAQRIATGVVSWSK